VGLVNLLTDLSQFRYYTSKGYTGGGDSPGMKSLKYGNDQLGGGNSGQPYIKVPIPDGFNDLQLANNDFILRGGALTARDSATDVLRLGKMFADTKSPNGVLFIAKQNLLSRTAVRTQASGTPNGGIYTPLSTLAEAGLVAFGGHVNKQGLNPFAGIGAGGYYDGTYLQALKEQTINVGSSNENRLVQLFGYKVLPQNVYKPNALKDTNNVNKSSEDILITYQGGPGSILGVGKTNINIARTNNDGPLQTAYNPIKVSPKPGTLGNVNFITTGYSGFILQNGKNTLLTGPSNTALRDLRIENELENVPIRLSNQFYTFNNERNTPSYVPLINPDFRENLLKILNDKGVQKTTILSTSPNYQFSNIEGRVNIGGKNKLGPGSKEGKNLLSYSDGSGIGPVDKLNALLLYDSEEVQPNSGEYPVNDLVKFRIAIISNKNPKLKTFIHFRAFIDNFSDSYNANWNPVTYLGRGENFYTYSNYTRNVSMGWTVVAQSKEELIPMYKKLNYLASSLTPDYTSNGYMAGNLVQLTVGGYLYETVGIINSLTYDIPEESPWEIGISDAGSDDTSVKELPHIIRVTNFSFTPIQNFIPSVQPVGNENGSSRYISLSSGDNNNYDTLFSKEETQKAKRRRYNELFGNLPNQTTGIESDPTFQ
jgi:hypothetical protein